MSESEKNKEKKAAAFGDLGFIDAGVGEEVAKAQESAASIVTDINVRRNATDEKRKELRAAFPDDILKRARAIAKEVPPDFKEGKYVNSGGTMIFQPLLTDTNMMAVFDVLFGDGPDRPHFDTFRGLTVGWTGEVINDDFNLRPLVEAMAVEFKLPAPTYERVEKLFKRYARQVRVNSLIERLKWVIPEWDGVERAQTQLIKLFEPLDTPMNREFGKYFWLSVYCRAMYPGCNASMVLALFGAHGAGKSYMGKIICEEMLGDVNTDTVTLDWSKDFNEFLRQITGQSVIANVAEMAGFGRAEMTKIKNLTTRTVDIMNYKFERDNQQLRQWVMIMDGNEYKGLQRDETGNRRFYPMFVGQLPFDWRAQVQWKEEFSVDFSSFREDFWQIMAECRAWMEEHKMTGYNKMVAALEKKVKAFSDEEMRNDRGTVRDDDLDAFILPALRTCAVYVIEPKVYRDEVGDGHAGRPPEKTGACVTVADIRIALNDVSGRSIRVIPTHLKTKLTSMGAEVTQAGNARVYLWRGIKTLAEWEKMLDGLDDGGMRGIKNRIDPREKDGGF